MKDLFLVLIGGLCAAFGGFVSTWYQAKKARQIKMSETIGVQQVEAFKEALSLISQLHSILIQFLNEDATEFITEHSRWVSENTILLPHKFVENWWSIRSNLRTAERMDKTQAKIPDGSERDKMIEDIVEINSFMDRLAEEAEKEIRNNLGLPKVEIQRPLKEN